MLFPLPRTLAAALRSLSPRPRPPCPPRPAACEPLEPRRLLAWVAVTSDPGAGFYNDDAVTVHTVPLSGVPQGATHLRAAWNYEVYFIGGGFAARMDVAAGSTDLYAREQIWESDALDLEDEIVSDPYGHSDDGWAVFPAGGGAGELTFTMTRVAESPRSQEEVPPWSMYGTTVQAWVPEATVQAVDAAAAEPTGAAPGGVDTGTYRIFRDGDGAATIDQALDVDYEITGDGITPDDYESLSGTATIDEGETFVDVVISPRADSDFDEGQEEALMTLTGGDTYEVGAANEAGVVIQGAGDLVIAPPNTTVTMPRNAAGAITGPGTTAANVLQASVNKSGAAGLRVTKVEEVLANGTKVAIPQDRFSVVGEVVGPAFTSFQIQAAQGIVLPVGSTRTFEVTMMANASDDEEIVTLVIS